MKLSIHEKFHSFLIRHNLTVSVIQKMIAEYANSELELARSHFIGKYGISEHVFYTCRDYAVICCLVDDNICKSLHYKTLENCRTHNKQNSSRASVAHFDELISQRTEYLLSYLDADVRDIARKYGGGMSAEQIGLAYETGKYGISKILFRGITELIVDRETVDSVVRQMPGSQSSIQKILAMRKKNKDELLSIQSKDIEALQYKIEHFSLYFAGEKDKPSVPELEEQLKKAMERYEKALEL